MKAAWLFGVTFLTTLSLSPLRADEMGDDSSLQRTPPHSETKKEKTRYFIEDTSRVDAGTFHVGFAAGGNFYMEPKFDSSFNLTGEYFNDFGFQVGVYFDYDYKDTPLGLRGIVGYKYILSSVHVFDLEAIARMLFAFSQSVQYYVGVGVSTGVWFRTVTDTSAQEETALLPTLVVSTGFDFNPFMTDFKIMVHRIGDNSTIMGLELSFGFRL